MTIRIRNGGETHSAKTLIQFEGSRFSVGHLGIIVNRIGHNRPGIRTLTARNLINRARFRCHLEGDTMENSVRNGIRKLKRKEFDDTVVAS